MNVPFSNFMHLVEKHDSVLSHLSFYACLICICFYICTFLLESFIFCLLAFIYTTDYERKLIVSNPQSSDIKNDFFIMEYEFISIVSSGISCLFPNSVSVVKNIYIRAVFRQ